MTEIIPAIMPTSFDDLKVKAGLVHAHVKNIQIDVMDGKFVPSRNWPLKDGQREEFEQMMKGDIILPYLREVDYEVDLMIVNPEENITEWVDAGFKRLIVHVESTDNLAYILDEWQGPIEIGIALNTSTRNDEIYLWLEREEAAPAFVQFMGIEKIGYQGNPFDEKVLDKIRSLRNAYPKTIISVDGGVNFDTAPLLLQAGANRLAVGSVIFAAPQPEKVLEQLQLIESPK